ncbi:nuclear transport factor 2 family protein [Paenarthrobacter sp. NPDC089714]|uniref:nuclear transport factor 2 family protein n=1 Tax=Paenarthrobacter sp. NPDC089714 TaxID=3364377 RepID=UPI003813BC2A
MTQDETAAVGIAMAYHRAWTTGDLETATTYLAGDAVCHTPAGKLTGSTAIGAFMAPFAATLTGSRLLAAHGNAIEAMLMYDTSSSAVASAPGAELYRVQSGLITEIHILFDRLPFALARGEVIRA